MSFIQGESTKRRLSVVLLVLGFATPAKAAWPTTTTVDVPVANVDDSQAPSVVADATGGAYVIFSHSDSTSSKSLRGEHFDAKGDRLWSLATDAGGYLGKDLLGMPIGTGADGFSQAVSDTLGGFIVGYTPGESSGPYTLSVQRFNDTPTAAWTPTGAFGGVQLLANPSSYSSFWMIADGLGGALLDEVGAASGGVVGQRVNGSGATEYGTGYVFAGAQYPGPFYPTLYVSNDGQGGMYFIYPPGGSESIDPILDYLTPTGRLSFTVPSVAPAKTDFEQWSISGLPTGVGAWATWYQYSSPTSQELLLQRFTSTGAAGLDGGADNGLVAASVTTTGPSPQLISDSAGGVVEVWFDVTSGVNVLYAQRFGANGAPKWGTSPVMISSSATTPSPPSGSLSCFRVVPTPDGNVAVFWVGTPNGIFAQKMDIATGATQWGTVPGGIQVSAVASPAWVDATFATDDSAYVGYQLGNDVFVKHVEPDGTLGATPAGSDAGPPGEGGAHDGGADTGPDAEADTGPDSGPDTGPMDAGTPSVDAHVGEDSGGHGHIGSDGSAQGDGGVTTGSSSGCGCRIQSLPNTQVPWRPVGLGLVVLVLARRSGRLRVMGRATPRRRRPREPAARRRRSRGRNRSRWSRGRPPPPRRSATRSGSATTRRRPRQRQPAPPAQRRPEAPASSAEGGGNRRPS